MGNKVYHQKKLKERDKEFQLRKSNLDTHRFNKLKEFLPQVNFEQIIDDISDESHEVRMCHYFLDPSKKNKTNFIKRQVSLNKIRFCNDFFDLDLCYITKRVIAMGYPSSGLEKLYRNSRESVLSFLTTYHPTHFKIYNLCEELTRFYNASNFANVPVSFFPIKDHNPTDLITILEFCVDSYLFLAQHRDNVITVHCKAGKGRTGLMICAYLLFIEAVKTPEEAFELYGKRRTTNGRGLTIPSQRRYVQYFAKMISDFLTDSYSQKIHYLVRSSNSIRRIKQGLSNKIELVGLNIGPIPHCKNAKITVSRLNGDNEWAGKIDSTVFNTDYAQFTLPLGYVIDEDFNIHFASTHLSFNCWVNTYFFQKESSRVLPRILNKPLVCTEFATNELDKLKSKFEDFTVIIMGYSSNK